MAGQFVAWRSAADTAFQQMVVRQSAHGDTLRIRLAATRQLEIFENAICAGQAGRRAADSTAIAQVRLTIVQQLKAAGLAENSPCDPTTVSR